MVFIVNLSNCKQSYEDIINTKGKIKILHIFDFIIIYLFNLDIEIKDKVQELSNTLSKLSETQRDLLGKKMTQDILILINHLY